MHKPQTKEEVLSASRLGFEKLRNAVEALPEEHLHASFVADERDRNIRDVLVHLHEWHKLLLAWVYDNLAGKEARFLPKDYTWHDYEGLNIRFRDEHHVTKLERAMSLVEYSHERVDTMISSLTDEQLFDPDLYPWTEGSPLAQYVIATTSSHYAWALEKIQRHERTPR